MLSIFTSLFSIGLAASANAAPGKRATGQQGQSASPFGVPVTYESIKVQGLNIACREAGDPASPKIVLLHGFPSSSHQYRNLVPALADRFHVIAPDYPGFGNSDVPDPATFPYTFDKIS